jgi:hypothetical protein
MYEFYVKNRNKLSNTFPGLVRMSLRLLVEMAFKDLELDNHRDYLNKYFDSAKSTLDKDIRTTLVSYSIDSKSLERLLHIGAHSYSSSLQNLDQTLAISVIIGAMLKVSHGK